MAHMHKPWNTTLHPHPKLPHIPSPNSSTRNSLHTLLSVQPAMHCTSQARLRAQQPDPLRCHPTNQLVGWLATNPARQTRTTDTATQTDGLSLPNRTPEACWCCFQHAAHACINQQQPAGQTPWSFGKQVGMWATLMHPRRGWGCLAGVQSMPGLSWCQQLSGCNTTEGFYGEPVEPEP